MNHRNKHRHNTRQKSIASRKRGCYSNLSSSIHFHHTAPASLADIVTLTEELKSCFPPAVGPKDLFDMASDRKKTGVDTPTLNKEIRGIEIGDMVKICFLVTDHKGLCLPPEMYHLSAQAESEAMFVRITDVEGEWPTATYHGELCSIPLLISPEKLQIRSPVTFETRHIHSCLETKIAEM